jgi:tRNA pseudouridine55 synthase
MGRPKGDPVDGVLLLDKPRGMSSGAAVGKARWLLSARKAGHTGTLDPLATGLLPLTFGEATKFSADLLDADKAYEARLRFGETTSTGDLEGEVTSRAPVTFGRAQLEAMLPRFTGAILQMPPMHSALKRDGRPLYALAREGRVVERAPRRVRIDRLELLAFDGAEAVLAIACSKGTYVRVLAEDLGAALGCGALLAGLRRTRAGALALGNAVTLEELEGLDLPARRARLLPPDALLAGLPRVELDAGDAGRFARGQRLPLRIAASPRVRVYARGAQLLGVASVDENGVLAPQRLVQSAAEPLTKEFA